jgi:hypothetical protein
VSPNAVRIALPLRAQVHRFFGAICALCRLATAALMLPSWSFTRTSSTRCSHAPRMRVARTESHTSAIDASLPWSVLFGYRTCDTALYGNTVRSRAISSQYPHFFFASGGRGP